MVAGKLITLLEKIKFVIQFLGEFLIKRLSFLSNKKSLQEESN